LAFELKDGQGTLFKNDRKEADKHPDYRGDLLIGGTLYSLAAWIKQGKSGKFMSLSAQVKGETVEKANTRAAASVDDDVPFR
jgi:uncharacterized protein (DUF736 family)